MESWTYSGWSTSPWFLGRWFVVDVLTFPDIGMWTLISILMLCGHVTCVNTDTACCFEMRINYDVRRDSNWCLLVDVLCSQCITTGIDAGDVTVGQTAG